MWIFFQTKIWTITKIEYFSLLFINLFICTFSHINGFKQTMVLAVSPKKVDGISLTTSYKATHEQFWTNDFSTSIIVMSDHTNPFPIHMPELPSRRDEKQCKTLDAHSTLQMNGRNCHEPWAIRCSINLIKINVFTFDRWYIFLIIIKYLF